MKLVEPDRPDDRPLACPASSGGPATKLEIVRGIETYPTDRTKAGLLAATALGMAWAAPVWAQDAVDDGAPAADSGNDIIVTAQRLEQRLQDVPISITRFGAD